MRLFLMSNGKDLNASEQDKYDFVISIASGSLKFDGIKAWLIEKSATMH